MGVSWVFEASVSSGSVERALVAIGADVLGSYSVDCTPYRPVEQGIGISTLYLLHHSQFPQTAFSIVMGDSFTTSPRTTSDRGFDLILHKLNSGLKPDRDGKFELTGTDLALKDFRIRAGVATQATQTKGCVVEVEYAPSCIAAQAIPILKDLMNSFPFFEDQLCNVPPLINKTSPDHYSAMETMHQYCSVFSIMRRRAG